METDPSEGWDAIADRFVAARSNVGADLVRIWARQHLPPHGSIVDVGCGSGVPIATGLRDDGFQLFGIDASPTLISEFRRRLPGMGWACDAAQSSRFFDRQFDAAVAIGLLFLLSENDQHRTITRIAGALHADARFLFSAPRETYEWQDLLTGRMSRSLGIEAYEYLLRASDMRLVDCYIDEGGNHYYDARKAPSDD